MSKAKFQHGKFFSELVAEEGSNRSKIQILRTGTWNHPEYGVFTITEADLDEFVFNFTANVVGHDICVDVNHDWNHTAIGWYKELIRDGNALFAVIEWTEKGLELVNSKEYRYFSPELYFTYKPADSDQVFRNVLYGGGITNRPFFKKMKALKMSEGSEVQDTHLFFDANLMAKSFFELHAEFSVKEKLSAEEIETAKVAFSELSDEDKSANTENMEGLEAKLDDGNIETPEEKETPPAESETPPPAPADEPPAPETPEAPLEASEKDKALLAKFSDEEKNALLFSMFGMSADQIKEVQSTASRLQKEKSFSEIKTRISSMTYSESNKSGTVNPNSVDQIAQFEEKLPESLRAQFEEILKVAFVNPTLFAEIGASEKKSLEFSVPTETPSGVTRESFVQSTIANKLFSEGKAKTKAESLSMAKKIIAENNIE